jgi:hypothetical protein
MRSMRLTSRGVTREPPFANGAYAVTSSSGVTSIDPRATDGTARNGLAMPLARATAITFASPTARLMRTVAVFDERISARPSVISPS